MAFIIISKRPLSLQSASVCIQIHIFYIPFPIFTVGERKPNSEDRSLEKAVEVIFGTNQSSIRAAVARTNQKLTKYLGNSKNRSREVLDDLIVSAESSLIDNYNYLPGGHWIPSTCLPRWKVGFTQLYCFQVTILNNCIRFLIYTLCKILLAIYLAMNEIFVISPYSVKATVTRESAPLFKLSSYINTLYSILTWTRFY